MQDMLPTSPLAWILVAVLVVLAWPYSQRAKHPQYRPLAAFLVFLAVFGLAGAVLFTVVAGVLTALGMPGGPVVGALGAAAVLIPAFLAARGAIRRPPWRVRPR